MNRWLRACLNRSLARRARHLAHRLAPCLSPGTSLLDIGSGTGHNAEALRLVTGGACFEVDVVDFHVVGPGPVRFDGSNLPFADDAVDVCLLAFVLNYADDPVALLRSARRVATRHVLVLQSTCESPVSRAAFRVRNWLQGRVAFAICRRLGLIPAVELPRQPHRWCSRRDLEALFAEAGLTLRRVEPEAGFLGISRDLSILDRSESGSLAGFDPLASCPG